MFFVLTAMVVSYGLSAQSDSAVWPNTTKVPVGLPASAFDSGAYSSSKLTALPYTFVKLGVGKTLKPKINGPYDIATYSMREFAPIDTNGTAVVATTGTWEALATSGNPGRYIEFGITANSDIFVTGIKAPMVSSGGSTLTTDIVYSTDDFATSTTLVVGKSLKLSKDTINTFNFSLPDLALAKGATFKVRLLLWNNTKAATTGKLFGFEAFAIYANSTPLPVKFGSINANLVNKKSLVSWSVENEINSVSYSIEKSLNGVDFKEIGSIAASKSGVYSFADQSPASINYYRIKSIDADGSYSYSSVVKVSNSAKSGIFVYPNPILDRKVNIQLDGLEAGLFVASVYNVNGQKVATSSVNLTTTTVSSLALPSSIKSGVYQLELVNGASRMTKSIIIK